MKWKRKGRPWYSFEEMQQLVRMHEGQRVAQAEHLARLEEQSRRLEARVRQLEPAEGAPRMGLTTLCKAQAEIPLPAGSVLVYCDRLMGHNGHHSTTARAWARR
jgi:hypothetical protein